MSITIECPGCRAGLQVPDRLAGKKLRCTTCRKEFRVGGEKPVDDEDDRPRRSRVRPQAAGLPVGVIIGIAAGVLAVVLIGGLGLYVLTRDKPLSAARPPERSTGPAPVPTPAHTGPISVRTFRGLTRMNSPASVGPQVINLSAPRSSGQAYMGARLYEMDYKFEGAQPTSSEFYYLVAKMPNGVSEIPLAALVSQDILHVQFFSAASEPKGDVEFWIERRPLKGSKRERVSNVAPARFPL
jgi:hypothetical protein